MVLRRSSAVMIGWLMAALIALTSGAPYESADRLSVDHVPSKAVVWVRAGWDAYAPENFHWPIEVFEANGFEVFEVEVPLVVDEAHPAQVSTVIETVMTVKAEYGFERVVVSGMSLAGWVAAMTGTGWNEPSLTWEGFPPMEGPDAVITFGSPYSMFRWARLRDDGSLEWVKRLRGDAHRSELNVVQYANTVDPARFHAVWSPNDPVVPLSTQLPEVNKLRRRGVSVTVWEAFDDHDLTDAPLVEILSVIESEW